MSKGHEHSENTKGSHKSDHAEGGKAEGAKKAEATAAPSNKKGHSPLPGGCFSWGCKAQANRFNFCDEHYDHFKFGLIRKTGEPVPDYESKIDHYMAFKNKKKKGLNKVA